MVKVSLFYYWIPAGTFPNPARILRRLGIWVDGSVWWIPTALLPYNLIHRMRTAGVDCTDVPLDESASEKILAIVRKSLHDRAVKAVNSVQKTADKPNDEEVTGKTDTEWDASRPARVRAAAKNAEKLLADLENAAGGFGLTGDDIRIGDVRSQLRIVRLVSSDRAAVYAKGTRTLRKKGADPGMTYSAETDQLPVPLLSDYLRDIGEDETADEIQEAFAE